MNISIKISLLALGVSSLLTGCDSRESASQKYLNSAMELFEEDQYSQAKIEFRNALQINPNIASAHYHIGLIEERENNPRGALIRMEKTLAIEPDNVAAIEKIAKIEILARKYNQALERADKILQLSPNNAEAYLIQAAGLLGLDEGDSIGDARNALEKAAHLGADQVETLALRASIARKAGDYESSISFLDQAIDLSENPLALRLAKLDVLEEIGNSSDIDKALEAISIAHPDLEKTVLFKRVQLALNNQDVHLAVQLLDNFAKRFPDDSESRMLMIQVLAKDDARLARQKLEKLIHDYPDNEAFRLLMARELIIEDQSMEQAKALLEELSNTSNDVVNANKAKALLAMMYFENGKYDIALQLIEEVLSQDPNHEDALVARSKHSLNIGNTDDAIKDIRLLIRNYPDAVRHQVLLARAYLGKGADTLALQTANDILKKNPTEPFAAKIKARHLINENQPDEAITLLEQVLKKSPDNISITRLLADALVKKEDFSSLSELTEKLRKNPEETANVHYLDGLIYQNKSQHEAAISSFQEALRVQPSLGAPVKGLARSFKAMNDIEGLKQALDTLIETDQADFIAYLASAKILASQGRQAEGLALLKQGLKHHSNIPANHLIFANYQIELGQVKNAISTYRDTIKAFPEELNIQHLLASLLIRQANYQEAANLYVGILEKKPDDVTAANNLASLYSEQLYSEDNIRKARQLSQIFAQSSNPAFQDTYAWILVKSGQADQALPTLQAIVDSHPDVSLFRYHLGIALTKAERFTEGQQVLNKAFELIQRSGEDPELVKLIEKELLIEKEHLIEKELL